VVIASPNASTKYRQTLQNHSEFSVYYYGIR